MRRTGFARKPHPKAPRAPLAPIPRDLAERISTGPARLSVMPKHPTEQSEPYRRLVAALPCDLCLVPNLSQCAHPNTGKAGGKKLIDDRLCFPLCADTPLRAGCHGRFDQGALMSKAERRQYEPEAGKRARDTINRLGLWPARLPQWPEDT